MARRHRAFVPQSPKKPMPAGMSLLLFLRTGARHAPAAAAVSRATCEEAFHRLRRLERRSGTVDHADARAPWTRPVLHVLLMFLLWAAREPTKFWPVTPACGSPTLSMAEPYSGCRTARCCPWGSG